MVEHKLEGRNIEPDNQYQKLYTEKTDTYNRCQIWQCFSPEDKKAVVRDLVNALKEKRLDFNAIFHQVEYSPDTIFEFEWESETPFCA